ncbi:hypothetical protein D1007_02948 [Hordeum vulgare]|nr:hypothetical protein D1007_02948 [Hordeum vulgare]
MSAFHRAHEEQRYKMFLLEKHRVLEDQINGDRATKEAVTVMAATNTNFITKQPSICEDLRAQATARHETSSMEVQLHATANENNASYASYTPPTNYRTGWSDEDNVDVTISIVDLMYTSDGQCAYSFADEYGMEAAGVYVPCGLGRLPCSTLPRRRPPLHFIGLIADGHGDGG